MTNYEPEEFQEALIHLYNLLGPKVPSCIKCQGCDYEWGEALRVIRNYVPIDKRFPQDREQPYLDEEFNY